ncbi:MAG: DUF5778 family protein [Halobacteriales archaeon]
MADALDEDLRRRTEALLEPGEIELNGAIVHTDLEGEEDIEMTDATLEVGGLIAETTGVEDWYVYSGTDDPEFASNQHQGRTMDEAFVWECQQLLREGTFDLVFYYEASIDQEALLAAIREAGYRVTGVEGS